MKKLLITICCLLLIANTGFGQAKKPTIMVLPSEVWCHDNGFMMKFDDQGTPVNIPDYKRAFQESSDLQAVIAKIGGIMSDRDFPLKDAEAVLKSLSSESAEDAMLTNKSGAGVSESPIDKLKKAAKADIIIQLTWKVNQTGPKKSITCTLKGLDSYTDKQIAEGGGTGNPSFSAEVPVLLEEAVLSNMDNFCAQLMKHFDDMFQNGREITIRLKKFEGDVDFEKEYDGKQLGDIIDDWMNKNTVNHRYSHTDNTENMQFYEQVRIPLTDAAGKAIDARAFTKGLYDSLKAAPYSIPCKLTTKGLGQATIVINYK